MLTVINNAIVRVGPQTQGDGRLGLLRLRLPGAVFKPNSQLTITAARSIHSGVIFTDETPPWGWDMLAEDDVWPYFGEPDSRRYSLVGAFAPVAASIPQGGFFFIGARRQLVGRPSTAPPPPGVQPWAWEGLVTEWQSIWLAVNRPPGDGVFGGGDGFWEVTINLAEFQGSDAPDCGAGARENILCTSVRRDLITISDGVRDLCNRRGHLRQAMDDRLQAIILCSSGIAGVGAGLVAFAALDPLGVVPATHASVMMLEIVGTLNAPYVAAFTGVLAGIAAGTILSLSAAFEPLFAVLAITITTALGAVIALGAVGVARTANPWLAIGYAILVVLGLALVASLLVLISNQIHDAESFDRVVIEIQERQRLWRAAQQQSRLVCCPNTQFEPDETNLPVCGA